MEAEQLNSCLCYKTLGSFEVFLCFLFGTRSRVASPGFELAFGPKVPRTYRLRPVLTGTRDGEVSENVCCKGAEVPCERLHMGPSLCRGFPIPIARRRGRHGPHLAIARSGIPCSLGAD